MAFLKKPSLEDKIILIEKINKIKSKAKKRFYFNSRISWCYNTFKCCSICLNKNKVSIFDKTSSILKKNLEIAHVIKKNLEFDFLKKLILTNKEFYLFPFQFKYINITNMTSTINYLNFLNDISKEKVEKPNEEVRFIEGKKNKYDIKQFFIFLIIAK